MDIQVFSGSICGQIAAPPSKSAAHRALICAALAGCIVSPVSESADMQATLGVLESLGCTYERKGNQISFEKWKNTLNITCNCKESGSTLRFLLPIVAALGLDARFIGEGRLPQRPLEPLMSLMKDHGINFSVDTMPFSISGKLSAGNYHVPGDISSQFISGLLFALPILEGDSRITITSPLQSEGYVDMTLQSLHAAGITVHKIQDGYDILGGQTYSTGEKFVEGDWSGAAFWLCAGALFGGITVTGLDMASVQGDRAIVPLLREMGAHIEVTDIGVSVMPSSLKAITIDAAPIPDLVPILAVTAAYAEGVTEIYNAARLRIKESDRLATVTSLLRAIGGKVEEFPDRLLIYGGHSLSGGYVQGANDHRIVMSAAIAALGCRNAVTISDTQAVEKSYPNFFEELQSIGGVYNGV